MGILIGTKTKVLIQGITDVDLPYLEDLIVRNLRAHYMAEATLVDKWVGHILRKVDDLRLWDDTVVVFDLIDIWCIGGAS